MSPVSAFAVGGRLISVWVFALSQMPRQCPVITKSIPEVHLMAPGPPRAGPAVEQELEKNQRPHSMGDTGQSPAVSDGGIHVYAHQRSERTVQAMHASSEEVGEALRSHSSPRAALTC